MVNLNATGEVICNNKELKRILNQKISAFLDEITEIGKESDDSTLDIKINFNITK